MGALAFFGTLAVAYFIHSLIYESTDDAFVECHVVPISARVPGHVLQVLVNDNDQVTSGQLILTIDPRDYEAALAQQRALFEVARANEQMALVNVELTERTSTATLQQATSGVDASRSSVEGTRSQLETARKASAQAQAKKAESEAALKGAEADADAAQAEAIRAGADLERFRGLMESKVISRQQFDQAEATAKEADARLRAARNNAEEKTRQIEQNKFAILITENQIHQAGSQLSEAQALVGEALGRQSAAETVPQQVSVSRAQWAMARAQVRQAEASVRQAELNLSYTRVCAPCDGRVTRKSVEAGGYVQTGQSLLALVTGQPWVVANFKETQLTRMRPANRSGSRWMRIPVGLYEPTSTRSSRARARASAFFPPKTQRAITSRLFSECRSRSFSMNRLTRLVCLLPACRLFPRSE